MGKSSVLQSPYNCPDLPFGHAFLRECERHGCYAQVRVYEDDYVQLEFFGEAILTMELPCKLEPDFDIPDEDIPLRLAQTEVPPGYGDLEKLLRMYLEWRLSAQTSS